MKNTAKTRLIRLLALVMLAAFALCGCGKTPSDAKPTGGYVEKRPDDPHAQAEMYLKEGKYEEAAQIYLDLGEQDKWAEVQHKYGIYLHMMGNYEQAIAALEKAGDIARDDLSYSICALAEEMVAQGDSAGALELLKPIADEDSVQAMIIPMITPEMIAAAEAENTELVLELAAMIKDKSFMANDWDYNDINRILGSDAVIRQDYEAAIEHFNRCVYEGDRAYVPVLQTIMAGDYMEAARMIDEMGYSMLEHYTGKSWTTIIYEFMGEPDETDLNQQLMAKALDKTMHYYPEGDVMDPGQTMFGDYSYMGACDYIGPIGDENVWLIDDLDNLYAQCGTAPNGKVLILREQQDYPRGAVYYAVDLPLMYGMYYDLFPSSLSEVEYVMIISYDYDHAGNYTRTTTYGDDVTREQVAFLKIRARVTLTSLVTGKNVYLSPWAYGGSTPEAWSGRDNWVNSNMPEFYSYICAAAESVR